MSNTEAITDMRPLELNAVAAAGVVADDTETMPPSSKYYSSVVYVHGMGSQRRYEGASLLVDQLDKYSRQQNTTEARTLCGIKVKLEALRDRQQPDESIAFIETPHVVGNVGKPSPEEKVRFYEVYWAPLLSGSKSIIGVSKWLARQVSRPWMTFFSPWRERQRLRRAPLVSLFMHGKAPPAGYSEIDCDTLLAAYDEFEDLEAQRKYPSGTFTDFLDFVSNKFPSDPIQYERLQNLARIWLHAYRVMEIRRALVLLSILLAVTLLFAAVFGASMILSQELGAILKLPPDYHLHLYYSIPITLISMLAGATGISRFLTDYLGDVEVWSTYEETDEKHVARNKVLDKAIATIRHVLKDPNCERVIIVAHSLGTSIAQEALLALNRINLVNESINAGDSSTKEDASPTDEDDGSTEDGESTTEKDDSEIPLKKIRFFITMGSPIDKIEYFFESYTSTSHRYKRVIEDLRGDIGTMPFTDKDGPQIHWINFWDLGDSFSNALVSPTHCPRLTAKERANNLRIQIDNFHVANFSFPHPIASHFGYFDNEKVIGTLFQIVYGGKGAFNWGIENPLIKSEDYFAKFVGPGDPVDSVRSHYFTIAAVTPWLILIALFAAWVNLHRLALVSWCAAVICATVLVAGLIASWLRGQRNSFESKPFIRRLLRLRRGA